jgi:hypothetical protein
VTCGLGHGILDGLEVLLMLEFSRTRIFGVIGTNILNMVDTSWSTKDIHPHHTQFARLVSLSSQTHPKETRNE